jgi:hypothetical protein
MELPLVDARKFFSAEYPAAWLDRSTAYRASALGDELAANQHLFDLVYEYVAGMKFRTESGDIKEPGCLMELLSVIHAVPRPLGIHIANVLRLEIKAIGYFDNLHIPMMRGYLDRVGPTSFWRETTRRWLKARDRIVLMAEQFLVLNGMMPHPLWHEYNEYLLRLAEMYNEVYSIAHPNGLEE